MKNIQVVDGALNCVYDIFQASDDDFAQIFGNESDIAFGEDFQGRDDLLLVFETVFGAAGFRRFRLRDMDGLCRPRTQEGVHDPTRRDEEAVNPHTHAPARLLRTLSRGATPQSWRAVPLVGNTNKIGRVNLD